MVSLDSLKVKSKLDVNGRSYEYFCLEKAAKELDINISFLPRSLKVLLENLLRNEDGESVTLTDIKTLANCATVYDTSHEINFKPARVLMQDFTGVPAVVDLASMRDFLKKNHGNPEVINPLIPVDLVIDHSVQVDVSGNDEAFSRNVAIEMERNRERYEFLKWGQSAFRNFRVVPPGTGICHQVNLEYLAKVVWGDDLIYPDSLVGTDSHTTMVNALSVLGWGVGGIEAEAAMLGQAITMLIPEVIGFKLTGRLAEGVTATDLVLTVTNMLRERGVVNKFVEFYGDGLDYLSVADRATIANMSPEYGATCGFFPIDQRTLEYLLLTGRDEQLVKLVEAYAKQQGMWRSDDDLAFFDVMSLELSQVIPVMAGPKRPQDKVPLSQLSQSIQQLISSATPVERKDTKKTGLLTSGDVVIAAITSCTNTSNPHVMVASGLVARKARKLGLKPKPWVKTSLAPGSQVVTEYLKKSDLQSDLDSLGFNLVGYGCTTCIGNSGPLADDISAEIRERDLVVAAVLSGNRNFEGRIHPLVKANYLASPPLVIIFALAGTVNIDILKDPICKDTQGQDVFLKDLWPTDQEIDLIVENCVTSDLFKEKYANVFAGDHNWRNVASKAGVIYDWDKKSTYIQNPPYFDNLQVDSEADLGSSSINIGNARVLALLGDSITTDHISPAGNIARNSPAALFLQSCGVSLQDFNSYGSRRGNHNVMMRGTFANIRLKNEMVNVEGGLTLDVHTGDVLPIFDAAMRYLDKNEPLVIIAGKEYGSGSSRDWAAKGTLLLNVKAVIAESFERIHRSNLIGMGVLPLTFQDGQTRKSLQLDGTEIISISGAAALKSTVDCIITRLNGSVEKIKLRCSLNTINECKYFNSGGVLHFVLLNMVHSS